MLQYYWYISIMQHALEDPIHFFDKAEQEEEVDLQLKKAAGLTITISHPMVEEAYTVYIDP